MSDDIGGVWRTIGNRHIFIRNGKSIPEAMKESGKFPVGNNKNRLSKEEIKKRLDESIRRTQTDTSGRGEDDSLARYTDKNGNLKPEREKIHREIIEEYFDGKEPVKDEEKEFLMTGGGSGTGKSNFRKNIDKKYFDLDMNNVVVIDADDIKQKLYIKGDDPIYDAGFFHEESSALAKRTQTVGLENNYNIMLDGTGDGGVEKLGKKIQQAKNLNYKVEACYGTCDVQKALENNLNRYLKGYEKDPRTARYVKEEEVVSLHSNVTKALMGNADRFDKVALYDMNDFKNIKKIAEGGNGTGLQIEKGYEKEFAKFLQKGELTGREINNLASTFRQNADIIRKNIKEGKK